MTRSKIVWMSVEDITPYSGNPRRNDDAVEYVANSIREFGFKQPIVVDTNRIIIAGHTRLKAAKRLGMRDVPVIVADDLTEDQVRAYRLADNKVGEYAEWDEELLAIELDDIEDIDMSEFGFDVEMDFDDEDLDLDFSELEEGEIIEPPAEPKTKKGDRYRLGSHILVCGDSTSKADIARLMDGGRADMVFTDPPWNVDYGQTNPKWKERKILNDNMSTGDFGNFLSDVFAAVHSAIKGGGAFVRRHVRTGVGEPHECP